MQTCAENELDYIASYYIARSLLEDGIIDKELFDKINIANARSMGTYPITYVPHIRQNTSNSVE